MEKKLHIRAIEKINEINTALPGLWCGTFLYGMVCQVIGIFLPIDRVKYSIGLWIGILMAAAMAFHMSYILFTSLELGAKNAQAAITKHSMLRYFAVVVILGILMMTDFSNPIAAFVGVMGLKAGAYLHPFMIKIGKLLKNQRENKEN